VLASGVVVILPQEIGKRSLFLWMAGIAGILLIASLFWPAGKKGGGEPADAQEGEEVAA